MWNSRAEYFALFAGLYFQKWDLTTSVLVSTSLFIDTIIVQTVDKRVPSLGPLDWKDWKPIQSPKSMEGLKRMEGTDSIAQQVTWHRRWELFPLTELQVVLPSLPLFIFSFSHPLLHTQGLPQPWLNGSFHFRRLHSYLQPANWPIACCPNARLKGEGPDFPGLSLGHPWIKLTVTEISG